MMAECVKRGGLCALWLVLSAGSLTAGDRIHVRGIGMARTFVAVSKGLDAAGTNPANLALPDSGAVQCSLLPLGFNAGSDFLTYDLYTSYFTGIETDSGRVGRYLGDQDKQRILQAFKGDRGELSAQASTRLFGVAIRLDDIGAFAFTIDYDFVGALRLPRQYADLLLYGNTPGSSFDFSGVDARAYWRRDFSLSYGTALPEPAFLHWLVGGATVKLVHGLGYYEVDRFTSNLHTAGNGVLSGTIGYQARWAGSDFVSDPVGDLFRSPAGSGMGFDVGITGGLTPWLSLGASVTDIGWIHWSEDVEVLTADTTVVVNDPSAFDDFSKVADVVKGRKTQGAAFSSALPTTLRLGFSAQVDRISALGEFPGELIIAGEYTQGLAGVSAIVEDPRLSFGFEYRPWHWFPVRSGISVGGVNGFGVAFGFGFAVGGFDVDFGTENVGWLLGSRNSSSGSLAVGMTLRFLN